MAVEFAADAAAQSAVLSPIEIVDEGGMLILDWRPTVIAMIDAMQGGADRRALAAGFHDVLAESVAAVAGRIGVADVLLTGGCFQNARLAAGAVAALRNAGHAPYWHHCIPPNDGGLAAGQCVYALKPLVEEKV